MTSSPPVEPAELTTTWPASLTLSTAGGGAGGTAAGGVGGGGSTVSIGLIVLVVLGALCAILGTIYGYIYFTRINPRSNRARKYVEQNPDDDGNQGTSTHLFMFRKP